MKKMYSEQEIIDLTIKLLERTSMYEDQYEQYVSRPSRTDFYDDLSPYVQVGERGYTLLMYERGVQMLKQKKLKKQLTITQVKFKIISDNDYQYH
ncbi:hypothetical protein [Paenibacillus sp. 8b26]|uniref:hypothetical protein n=1 Tax=Paenibacillus sp. 8b26 TaxID=3424133 RepID=UPI003D657443